MTYRRARTKGASYFFTLNTHQRRKVLTEQPYYSALKESIKEVNRRHPIKIEAFVLLPDHLHCIWTLPEGDADYSIRWNIIKRLVSQKTSPFNHGGLSQSRIKRRESGLWQRRFWEHQIRDELDWQRHFEYIHWNPIKHGYVTRVMDWPYSSFHRYVAKGIYPQDWGGSSVVDDAGRYGEGV